MENEIEIEFECQICMDIMVEPVTTLCGHTFCKICLMRYLRTKLNCPICRKTILQSPDSLSKNISFENLIKSKYSEKYEERLKTVRLSYQDESNAEANIRRNIPTIYLENSFVWPRIKRRLIINNMTMYSTIHASSINDRLLIISQDNQNYSEQNQVNISSLVEILSLKRTENHIDLEVIGLKRFRTNNSFITQVNDDNHLYLSHGEIIKDLEITSDEIISEIRYKLCRIADLHGEILLSSNYSVQQQLERAYGKPPTRQNILSENNLNSSQLEFYSFFFLNLIKSSEKTRFYVSNNLIERINW